MPAPFPNLYTHRQVAATAAKACDICYKASTSVLITPDKKDFFYICPIHLKDTHFCTPKIDEEAVKAKREKELAEETEKLKTEYEEKQRKKKEKKDKDKNEKKEKKDDEKDEETSKPSSKSPTPAPVEEEEPRVFILKNTQYLGRIQKKRHIEAAKRDQQRMMQPGYFPSVPTHLSGKGSGAAK